MSALNGLEKQADPTNEYNWKGCSSNVDGLIERCSIEPKHALKKMMILV
jgi:hypothetical protein